MSQHNIAVTLTINSDKVVLSVLSCILLSLAKVSACNSLVHQLCWKGASMTPATARANA